MYKRQVLPSGVVINAQQVANDSGLHDRVAVLDTSPAGQDNLDNPNFSPETASVALQLLDGWQGGAQYYFHIVTDTNNDGAAGIEKGVFAPKLGDIPTFGNFPGGAFLPFSPVVNGNPTEGGDADGNVQGLNVASDSDYQDQDPTNTFPIDPDTITDGEYQYTPMWDAHLLRWDASVPFASRVILKDFEQIDALLNDGEGDTPNSLSSFAVDGTTNANHFGINSAGATINCPVISQPLSLIHI